MRGGFFVVVSLNRARYICEAKRERETCRFHPRTATVTTLGPTASKTRYLMKRLPIRKPNGNPARARLTPSEVPGIATTSRVAARISMLEQDQNPLTGASRSVAEQLGMSAAADIEFDPPRSELRLRHPAWLD